VYVDEDGRKIKKWRCHFEIIEKEEKKVEPPNIKSDKDNNVEKEKPLVPTLRQLFSTVNASDLIGEMTQEEVNEIFKDRLDKIDLGEPVKERLGKDKLEEPVTGQLEEDKLAEPNKKQEETETNEHEQMENEKPVVDILEEDSPQPIIEEPESSVNVKL